jgi:nicotinamidase-related amidase
MNMTVPSLSSTSLAERSAEYLHFLESWARTLRSTQLSEIIESAGGPEQVAVLSVDLIVGFCHSGPLASPRVAAILPAVNELFSNAYSAGIRTFALAQDTHVPDADEFTSYPPHCVAGSQESETVPELSELPFFGEFTIIRKNSISSVIAPEFLEWEQAVGRPRSYIIVGDCTDLCVYQAAMALKTRSNSEHLGQRVIVPENCVATYDISVQQATDIGAEPHPGDLLHHVFLHSMASNGVEVIGSITA